MNKKTTIDRIKTPDTLPIYTDDAYDEGNIPEVDLPKGNPPQDVIPDEVPRKDGPGGEDGEA